ncbi:MAG: DUF4686 domain-containing protein [Candidatus Rokubacteria bacterium]|nr:DUF4686 domain-containing protein [Candidatus Rokubacteria bacterium]
MARSTAGLTRSTTVSTRDSVYRRLERLEQEYYAIVEVLRRIESLLADEQVKREILERRVNELKHQVAALQDRVQELEQRLRG